MQFPAASCGSSTDKNAYPISCGEPGSAAPRRTKADAKQYPGDFGCSSPGCETVLVAMGYCGGPWNHIPLSRRVVIPKVDDCITLLLHTDDTPHGNLKEAGHMYFRDCDTGAYSIEGMKEEICRTYGMEFGTSIFGSWFQNYTNADIIDTGVYDCYSEEYVTEAQKNADLIRCSLGYVEGSNRILEKLVSGQWDAQFIVLESGQEMTEQDFGLSTQDINTMQY